MSPFTCNLQLREDIVNFASESFGYDVAANRLTSSQVGSNAAMVYIYDDIGNIMMKSDAGNYTYDPTKIHAVTGVAGNQGTIPSFNQDIVYTSFGKVETITENGHILEFTYGHDRLRRKTQRYLNSVLQETKYYLGNYEKVVDEITGVVTEFHYISAPSGMFAVFTKATGQPDKLQYIHTDHLGSVQCITNENGTIGSQHSFDAWGRSRNPLDWSDYTTTSLPEFNRGFTGHEHLPDFGLINMNGRLYDPVLGRMLSADSYIQNPGNSQNYNRYSYCLNNPLLLSDPTGEWSGWDDLIVAGAGFGYGYVSYGIINDDWGWRAAASGGISAGVFLLGYYSGGATSASSVANGFAANAGNSYAATVALGYSGRMVTSGVISSILPSATIPIGDNAAIKVSPTFLLGSGGNSAGLNLQVYGEIENVSLGFAIGASHGTSSFTGISHPEVRLSGFAGYDYEDWSIGLSSTQFFSGKTSQRLGRLELGYKDYSMSYENDGYPFDKIGFGGGSDDHRTAAVTLGHQDYAIGMLLFTGHRNYKNNVEAVGYPNDKVGNPEISEYNAGILYVGHNNMRIGWNHDNIRHVFQNRFAHNLLRKQPWIPRQSWPNEPYAIYGTNNPYTNW